MRVRAEQLGGAGWAVGLGDARRAVGRPVGEVAQAMLRAAEQQPGSVRELAARAQVGYGVARYTATRLVDRGQLQRVSCSRPAVLAAAGVRSFWDAADDVPPPERPASQDAMQAFACL